MAKKQTMAPPAPAIEQGKQIPAWAFPIAIMAIAFLVYANTLGHGYALDDSIVVSENKFTQRGFEGIADIFSHESFVGYFGEEKALVAGARYRPLSIATLAVEVGLFGKNHPAISHFINVLLFMVTCLLVYRLAERVLPTNGNKLLPAFAAALFAVHPIHTEAVANIKGRDEIMALLFTLAALVASWDWVSSRKVWLLPVAGICWALAFFSKESPLPLLAVLPFMLLLHPQLKSWKDAVLPTGIFVLSVVFYLMVRVTVTRGLHTEPATDLLNNSFRDATPLQTIGTAFYCLAYYVKLLFVPYPLTHDYYPYQIPLVNPWHPIALLGIALTVGMAVFAVVGIWNKKPFGWMLLFYLATMSIVSNLVFNIGVFMAERFLFLPSLAFCLLVPHLVTRFAKSKTLWAISGVVLVSFSALTMMRNPVWRDNTKLFRTDVENSPNSAKARTAGGAEAWKASKKETNPKKKADLLDEALLHINRAVEIYPGHALAWDFRGHILMDRMQYAEALQSYDKAISLQPESPLFVRNKGVAASVAKEYGQSAQAFEKYLKLAPSDASAWYDLGLVYENSKDYPKSVAAYEKCVSLQPTQSEALGKIGMIQGRYMNRGDSAIFYMEKALQVGGQQEWIYNNLGIAYAMQGNLVKSAEVLEKGVEKYPNSRDILPSLILTQTNLGNVARANELRARLNQQPQ